MEDSGEIIPSFPLDSVGGEERGVTLTRKLPINNQNLEQGEPGLRHWEVCAHVCL